MDANGNSHHDYDNFQQQPQPPNTYDGPASYHQQQQQQRPQGTSNQGTPEPQPQLLHENPSNPLTPDLAISPFGTHLGRNKACQSCRARKLKCDGQKPVCSQCSKAWAIKHRISQSKAKKSKDGKNAAQPPQELLPEHIPPCVYLPLNQKQPKSSRQSTPIQTPTKSSLSDSGGNDDQPASSSAGRKRKRSDNQSDQILRMQQEIDELKERLGQATGTIQTFAAAAASPTYNVPKQRGARQHHPSSDELAIAEMLATSMPSGEGPATSQGINGNESNVIRQTYGDQAHAGSVSISMTSNMGERDLGQEGQDGTIGILDPALDQMFTTGAAQTGGEVSLAPPSLPVLPDASSQHAVLSASSWYDASKAALQTPNPQSSDGRELWPHQGSVEGRTKSAQLGSSTGSTPLQPFNHLSPMTPSNQSNADTSGKEARVEDAHDEDLDIHSPLMQLVVGSWPSDFPAPSLVHPLVESFFKGFHVLGITVHPGRFMASMQLKLGHPKFPHRGFLHAILAHGYLRIPPSYLVGSDSYPFGTSSVYGRDYDAQSVLSIRRTGAAFHSERARAYIQSSMEEGQIDDACRILTLLCSYYYFTFSLMESWTTAGMAVQASKALELYRLPKVSRIVEAMNSNGRPRNGQGGAGYGLKAKLSIFRGSLNRVSANIIEHEQRVRLFWSTFYVERNACSNTNWAVGLDEKDITTELPAPYEDFINESPSLLFRERQNLRSPDLFTAKHYDPSILNLKACILLGRCSQLISRVEPGATVEDLLSPAFYEIDSTIFAFLQSFPPSWRDIRMYDPILMPACFGEPDFTSDGLNGRPEKLPSTMTVQLVLAHAVTHCATIVLHEPLAEHVEDSRRKCEIASDAVVNIIKVFAAARVELKSIGPIITVTFVFAGRCNAIKYKRYRREAAKKYFHYHASHTNRRLPDMDGSERAWQNIEEQMEMDMEADPTIEKRVDPEGKLVALRNDLELLFWALLKYGQTFSLGRGQARILAQLLGKDYTAEMEVSGLFKTGGGGPSSTYYGSDENSPVSSTVSIGVGPEGGQNRVQEVLPTNLMYKLTNSSD
ncbi:hypothetical protein IE53DRAFT_176288 [Violaceomyces palustris]|uniref:Uncharacterized protein n=1 Tax=Violaceomyces palustris TaxID=1673888 RepID=A0ACD0NSN9_9BASI|nr:hypothetical protein IE53DRAFT_176288 [Violaceomyces palustris]